MKNVLYQTVLVHPSEATDWNTATLIILTEEANCFIVWFQSAEVALCPIWIGTADRNKAIEQAVELGKKTPLELAEMEITQ